MHYGVDETGDYGAYTTELAFRIQKFTVSVWSGFGTGNDYQEWDFAAAYTFDMGTVFFVPGGTIFVISRALLSMSIPRHPKKITSILRRLDMRSMAKLMSITSTATQAGGIRIIPTQMKSFLCWALRRFRMSPRACSSCAI